MELYNSEKYDEAIEAFSILAGYGDSEKKIEDCYIGKIGEEKYNQIKNITVGDTYSFGHFSSDNSKSKQEPIEWIVLSKNGLSLMLITKKAITTHAVNPLFGQGESLTFYSSCSWESCELRKWLNSVFLSSSFSSQEQEMLIVTTNSSDEPNLSFGDQKISLKTCNNTNDKVYILSASEAYEYFKTQNDRIANDSWWVRTMFDSDGSTYVFFVDESGAINQASRMDQEIGIRPVIWINLG